MDSELKEHIKQGDIVEMIGNLSVDINNMPKPRLGTVINRNNAYVLVKPEGKDYMIDFLITEVEYHSAGNINLDRTPSPSGGIKTETPFYEILNEKLRPLGKSVHSFDLPTWNAILNSADEFHNQFAGEGWKDVKDRLPEDVPHGYYNEYIIASGKEVHWKAAYYDHKGKCWRYTPLMKQEGVTHWQPLPQPPQNTKKS